MLKLKRGGLTGRSFITAEEKEWLQRDFDETTVLEGLKLYVVDKAPAFFVLVEPWEGIWSCQMQLPKLHYESMCLSYRWRNWIRYCNLQLDNCSCGWMVALMDLMRFWVVHGVLWCPTMLLSPATSALVSLDQSNMLFYLRSFNYHPSL